MDVFEWVDSKLREYGEAGDSERFELASVRYDHYSLAERNVDAYLQVLREAANKARAMNEPLWTLYYDAFYLEALLYHKKDFRQALDLAARCVLEVRKPTYHAWPGRFVVYNTALFAYTGVDPWGYEKPIQDLLDALDKEVPRKPNHDRQVAMLRRCEFAMERELWDEARRISYDHLPQAQEFGNIAYLYDIQADLFYIEYFRGNWDGMFAFPDLLEKLTEEKEFRMELAESLAWRAAAARHRGNEEMAQKRYRSAASRIARVSSVPSCEYFQAIVAFHEEGADWENALRVRDRELEIVAPSGRTLYECQLRIDRCRLLRKLGRETTAEEEKVREAASRLRDPRRVLAKLERSLGA